MNAPRPMATHPRSRPAHVRLLPPMATQVVEIEQSAQHSQPRRTWAAQLFIYYMVLACAVGGFAVLLAMRPLWLAIPLSLLLCGISAVLAQLAGKGR